MIGPHPPGPIGSNPLRRCRAGNTMAALSIATPHCGDDLEADGRPAYANSCYFHYYCVAALSAVLTQGSFPMPSKVLGVLGPYRIFQISENLCLMR